MQKLVVVVPILLILSGLALADPTDLVNPGFEAGDLSGWNSEIPAGGSITVIADDWGIAPVEGGGFAFLESGAGNAYTRVWQTFSAEAGDVLSGWAYFRTTDFVGYEDNGQVQVRTGGPDGTVVALLFDADIDAVGTEGETGWTYFEYVVPGADTYTLEARVENSFDAFLDSYLGLDAVSLVAGAPVTTEDIDVQIDVKPGSDVNPINTKSKGRIPVALLGSESCDVTEVDVSTLAFGPAGAAPSHGHGHIEDVNADGYPDLVLHFDTQDAGFERGDTEATLVGAMIDGTPIAATDHVKVK
jgi:hypothetical protein